QSHHPGGRARGASGPPTTSASRAGPSSMTVTFPSSARPWQLVASGPPAAPPPRRGEGWGEGDLASVTHLHRNPLSRSTPSARIDLSPLGRGKKAARSGVSA